MDAYLQHTADAGVTHLERDPGYEGERRLRLRRRPAVGEVQVREEQNPAAEETEEHDDAVDLVQQSVLLLILKRNRKSV